MAEENPMADQEHTLLSNSLLIRSLPSEFPIPPDMIRLYINKLTGGKAVKAVPSPNKTMALVVFRSCLSDKEVSDVNTKSEAKPLNGKKIVLERLPIGHSSLNIQHCFWVSGLCGVDKEYLELYLMSMMSKIDPKYDVDHVDVVISVDESEALAIIPDMEVLSDLLNMQHQLNEREITIRIIDFGILEARKTDLSLLHSESPSSTGKKTQRDDGSEIAVNDDTEKQQSILCNPILREKQMPDGVWVESSPVTPPNISPGASGVVGAESLGTNRSDEIGAASAYENTYYNDYHSNTYPATSFGSTPYHSFQCDGIYQNYNKHPDSLKGCEPRSLTSDVHGGIGSGIHHQEVETITVQNSSPDCKMTAWDDTSDSRTRGWEDSPYTRMAVQNALPCDNGETFSTNHSSHHHMGGGARPKIHAGHKPVCSYKSQKKGKGKAKFEVFHEKKGKVDMTITPSHSNSKKPDKSKKSQGNQHLKDSQSLGLDIGTGRLFAKSPTRLQEIANRNGVELRLQQSNSSCIHIKGCREDVTKVKKELTSLREKVFSDSIEMSISGISRVLHSQEWHDFVRTLEKKYDCCVVNSEKAKDPNTQAKQKRGENSQPKRQGKSQMAFASDSHATNPCDTYRNGNVRLSIEKGDLTQFKADVLVNTIVGHTHDLKDGGSVSNSFLKAGGKKLQTNYDWAKNSQHGTVITDPSGGLKKCDMVFHIRLTRWDAKISQENLTKTIRDCLYRAVTSHKKTIAFPVMGSGILKYPQDEVAKCFIKAMDKAAEKEINLQVFLIAYNDEAFKNTVQHFWKVTPPQNNVGNKKTEEETFLFEVKAWKKQSVVDAMTELEAGISGFIQTKFIQLDMHDAKDARKIHQLENLSTGEVSIKLDHQTCCLAVTGHRYYIPETMCRINEILYHWDPQTSTIHNVPDLDLLQLVDEDLKCPTYWKNKPGPVANPVGKKYKLVPSDASTKRDVERLVRQSMLNPSIFAASSGAATTKGCERFLITNVEHVENHKLWEVYEKERKKLIHAAAWNGVPSLEDLNVMVAQTATKKMPHLHHMPTHKANEVLLFHGTGGHNINKISQCGVSGSALGSVSQFGRGIYFAESAGKADMYTDPAKGSDERHMFLMRVLLGKPQIVTRPRPTDGQPCSEMYCLTQDDCRESQHRRYDSVIGIGKDWESQEPGPLAFREFIIFDPHRCYPEFIITYKHQ